MDSAGTPDRDAQEEVVALLAALGDVAVHVDHIAAVVGRSDAGALLDTLRSRGMVDDDGTGRYRLADPAVLPTGVAEERAAWTERVVEHLIGWLSEPEPPDPRRVAADLDLVTAGLQWAAGSRRWRHVLRLARALDPPLALSGRWGSWEDALGHGLDAARALGDQAGEAWALHQLGTRALGLGDAATANRHLATALGLRERLRDRPGAALTRHGLRIAERLGGGGD